tara:strand:- start:728 stop:1030 length:303 start_codon:yes stop_codon:yes gene_type:complete
MDKSNLDINIIDFIDLIDETLNATFIEKWRYKYSERFIKQFQFKILSSLTNSKPLKIDSLYLFFTKKGKYSKEQVLNFFSSIDINIYRPLIQGTLTKHKN